ncbi:MAG: flippase-like domain-containing protein [Thermoplasmata archaeon]|nr:MAG: flippase-like domain-containing protein [Thermoplasmata archaeon]
MKRKLALLIVVSVVMIIMMILLTDPKKMAHILRKTNVFIILCVIGLYLLNGFVKALRWHLLVRSSGSAISFSRIYLFLLIGLMVNNTTPGRVGGEPVRAYLLRSRDDVPIGQGLSTIFAERIMDLIVLTSMALIGVALIIPFLVDSDFSVGLLLISFIPVIVVIITLIYMATHPELLRRAALGLCIFLKKVSKKDWAQKAESGLLSFVDSFSEGIDNMGKDLRTNKKTGFAFVVLTVLVWLNEAGRIYLILLALPGIEAPSFGAVLIASSVATVFGAVLPIGAMHATLITSVFAALQIDVSSAAAAGILVVMTSIWLSIPLGILAMFVVGLKIDKKSGEIVKKGENEELEVEVEEREEEKGKVKEENDEESRDKGDS